MDQRITAGIDCGSKTTKCVIVEGNDPIGIGLTSSGFDIKEAINRSLNDALSASNMDRECIERIGVTGAGAGNTEIVDIEINEIRAMGRGAVHFFPGATTVVDVGAEMARTARLSKNGNVEDFAMNEKCAAGAGAFIEAMSRALGVPLEDMGELANQSNNPIPMNAQCVIFAESEVVGQIHANTPVKDICRAIHDAMASRIASMIRRVGPMGTSDDDIVVMGGVALNTGFIEALKRELMVERLRIPRHPLIVPAVGAALIAREEGSD